MEKLFTALIEQDVETGYFIGIIPSVPGAHTQAKRLDQLSIRLKEVLELCLESTKAEDRNKTPIFFGTQKIAIAV